MELPNVTSDPSIIRKTCDRSMAAATPGPWELNGAIDDSGEEAGCQFIVGQDRGGLIGAAMAWPTELESGDFYRVAANARLMAAAPELIEALKDAKALLASLKRNGGVVSVPIATWGSQARSETKSFWCVPTWNLSDAEDVIEAAEAAIKKATGE